jgi:hypothetical protein
MRRADLNIGGRLTTARRSCLDEHGAGDLARAAKRLGVREAVGPAESPDRRALRWKERQPGMRRDRIAQRLEFAIDTVLPEHGREGARVEEDVDVLGESLDQIPTLRQAGAALEDDFLADR